MLFLSFKCFDKNICMMISITQKYHLFWKHELIIFVKSCYEYSQNVLLDQVIET